ncbi:hypothetical protein ACOMHN_063333 [Nucella lapillus]
MVNVLNVCEQILQSKQFEDGEGASPDMERNTKPFVAGVLMEQTDPNAHFDNQQHVTSYGATQDASVNAPLDDRNNI